MQQIVKFGAAAELGVDLLVLADSDVVLVRPVTIDTFRNKERVRFYRSEGAVDERLPRHLLWHEVARKLLGLPPAEPAPLPDYISAFNVWDRRVVLALQERIEAVTGRPWLDAIASQLHVSEFILYGVFVDDVLGASAPVIPEDSMLCHSHWGPEPMADATVPAFIQVAATGGRCGDDLRALGNRAGCATKGAVQRSLQRRAWELRCGIERGGFNRVRRPGHGGPLPGGPELLPALPHPIRGDPPAVYRDNLLAVATAGRVRREIRLSAESTPGAENTLPFIRSRAGPKFDERFGANGSSKR